MEKRVKENTWVVDGSRDASTAEAIIAEFVEIEAGSLSRASAGHRHLKITTYRAPGPPP